MAPPIPTRPDALVLGAGGTLGIAWLRGLLAGLEEGAGVDFRRCEYFVGTSAGSVVAANLAAGVRPPDERDAEVPDAAAQAGGDDEPAGEPGAAVRLLRSAAQWTATATAPLAPLALRVARPGGEAVRAGVLAATPRPTGRLDDLRAHIERLGTRFDGRLRIATVDRRSGRRVVFGAPGAPRAAVADAVIASCSVPWIFEPVVIGGREYVDGGVWSPSNLDAAPVGRGSEVLAVLPLGAPARRLRSPAGAIRAAAQAATLAELGLLRSRGVRARILTPDRESTAAMGWNLMDPRYRRPVEAAGRAQGLRLATGSA